MEGKYMKKIICCAVLCVAALASLSLSGCRHEHSFAGWQAGANTHWHECIECKEKLDETAHSFDEFTVCTECGASVYKGDDGSVSIYTYDKYGGLIRDIEYDPDGKMIYSYRYEIEYDAVGYAVKSKEYTCDILNGSGKEYLSMEMTFKPVEGSENGDVYATTETFYREDGSGTSYEYDEKLGVTKSVVFDSKGNITETKEYDYELDDKGEVVKETVKSNGILIRESFYEDDGAGGRYVAKDLIYDASGKVTDELYFNMYGEEIDNPEG